MSKKELFTAKESYDAPVWNWRSLRLERQPICTSPGGAGDDTPFGDEEGDD